MSIHSGVRTEVLPAADEVLGTLRLTNDGVHWTGTFHVLVRALLDDLLPEGPINVQVQHLTPATVNGREDQFVTGRLSSLDTRAGYTPVLVFDDGYRIALDDVLAIAV